MTKEMALKHFRKALLKAKTDFDCKVSIAILDLVKDGKLGFKVSENGDVSFYKR